MPSRRYKNSFEIKSSSNTCDDVIGVADIHIDVKRFMDIHGGCIEFDANLNPGEYLYYTDADEDVIKGSILVDFVK